MAEGKNQRILKTHRDGTVELIDENGLSIKIAGDRTVWFKLPGSALYEKTTFKTKKGASKESKAHWLLMKNQEWHARNQNQKNNTR